MFVRLNSDDGLGKFLCFDSAGFIGCMLIQVLLYYIIPNRNVLIYIRLVYSEVVKIAR